MGLNPKHNILMSTGELTVFLSVSHKREKKCNIASYFVCNRVSNLLFSTVLSIAREQIFWYRNVSFACFSRGLVHIRNLVKSNERNFCEEPREEEALQDSIQRISVMMCLSQLLLLVSSRRSFLVLSSSFFLTLLNMLDFGLSQLQQHAMKTVHILKQIFSCKTYLPLLFFVALLYCTLFICHQPRNAYLRADKVCSCTAWKCL